MRLSCRLVPFVLPFFFSSGSPSTGVHALSLHDALPILGPRPWRPSRRPPGQRSCGTSPARGCARPRRSDAGDRKSTRLNSSHLVISYAVFCLKKKKSSRGLVVAQTRTGLLPLAPLKHHY